MPIDHSFPRHVNRIAQTVRSVEPTLLELISDFVSGSIASASRHTSSHGSKAFFRILDFYGTVRASETKSESTATNSAHLHVTGRNNSAYLR